MTKTKLKLDLRIQYNFYRNMTYLKSIMTSLLLTEVYLYSKKSDNSLLPYLTTSSNVKHLASFFLSSKVYS